MKAATSTIDSAVQAYQSARHDGESHHDAIACALATIRRPSEPEILAAEAAYTQYRSPARWDGPPWGECGTKNHRAGIKAAIQSLETLSNETIERIAQQTLGNWPCICGGIRPKENYLLCPECWKRIPQAKQAGLARLDRASIEHHMACEQILRIARRNLEQK